MRFPASWKRRRFAMRHLRLVALTVIGAAALAGSAQAKPGGGRHFLEDALKGDNSEMMLGALASERGESPDLRRYGQTLRDDHAQAREQVVPLARRAGVAITDQAAPEARQEKRKLERLHGRAFDREFASYMVKDHRKDIAEFEAEARGRGPTADLARQTLPTLRKHLAMAQEINRR
jgi:putative membrane protein